MRATLALFAALLLPVVAGAQGIGNPVFSHYDFVVQGSVEYASLDRDLDSGRQKPETSELTTTLFKGVVGVHPRLDLHLLLGQANLDLCAGDAQDICEETARSAPPTSPTVVAPAGPSGRASTWRRRSAARGCGSR